MSWLARMNETSDYVSLVEQNAMNLRSYLRDSWPISMSRLVARQQYEEMLKNMVRRAKAMGCDPDMISPEFAASMNQFVRQNVDAEEWHRKMENKRHYERADAEATFALNEPLQASAPLRPPDRMRSLRQAAWPRADMPSGFLR